MTLQEAAYQVVIAAHRFMKDETTARDVDQAVDTWLLLREAKR